MIAVNSKREKIGRREGFRTERWGLRTESGGIRKSECGSGKARASKMPSS